MDFDHYVVAEQGSEVVLPVRMHSNLYFDPFNDFSKNYHSLGLIELINKV